MGLRGLGASGFRGFGAEGFYVAGLALGSSGFRAGGLELRVSELFGFGALGTTTGFFLQNLHLNRQKRYRIHIPM